MDQARNDTFSCLLSSVDISLRKHIWLSKNDVFDKGCYSAIVYSMTYLSNLFPYNVRNGKCSETNLTLSCMKLGRCLKKLFEVNIQLQ